MAPADALRQIAYLLEAEGADTYKVRAFRRAADGVDEVGDDEVRRLAEIRRLGDIPGVGDTTAQVIAEALAGERPAYLAELEDRSAGPLTGRAAELRAILRGDCHSHSTWSDGGASIREMADAARQLGHEYLVVTDHSPRLTVAHGLNAERLGQQLDEIAALNAELAPFRILTGIEVDILEDGALDQSEELLAALDVVVASVHSKLAMDEAAMTKRMLRAIESPHSDILGHCTGRKVIGKGRPESKFDADRVFEACARTGTAVEINSRPDRRDPPAGLLSRALEHGCVVTIDTDAHAPGQLEWLRNGCEQAAEVHLEASRIVNRFSVDELRDWAASHVG